MNENRKEFSYREVNKRKGSGSGKKRRDRMDGSPWANSSEESSLIRKMKE